MQTHKTLEAWKVAHEVAVAVYRARQAHWSPCAGVILGQLQRAALSVQLNIVEGYALKSPRRLLNHLTIAYGSGRETIECLEFCRDVGAIPSATCDELVVKADRVCGLLLGLMKRFRNG